MRKDAEKKEQTTRNAVHVKASVARATPPNLATVILQREARARAWEVQVHIHMLQARAGDLDSLVHFRCSKVGVCVLWRE